MAVRAWVPAEGWTVQGQAGSSYAEPKRRDDPIASVFSAVQLARLIAAADICQRKAQTLEGGFGAGAPVPVAVPEDILQIAPADARVQAEPARRGEVGGGLVGEHGPVGREPERR